MRYDDWKNEGASVSDLLGKTLVAIDGLSVGEDRVTFTTADGKRYVMWHSQDCCESVSVNEIVGNVDDLIGSPLTLADESTKPMEDTNDTYGDTGTWTFYNFATVKGYVTIRWLGTSNGYYSESVSFAEDS